MNFSHNFLLRFLLALVLLGTACVCHSQERLARRFELKVWTAEQGLSAGQILSVAQGAEGYLWLGTEKGLFRFDGFSFQRIPLPARTADAAVQEVVSDHDGVLWFRTREARLLRVSGYTQTEWVSSIPQEFEIIPAVSPAVGGGLLVAAAARGLVRLRGDAVEDLHTKGPDLIVSLAQTEPTVVWLGTRGHGLYRWSQGVYAQVPGTMSTTQITSLLPAPHGELWVGTDRGLYQLDEQKFRFDKPVTGTENFQVLALIQDHKGSIWAGTSAGLLRISDGHAEWIRHTSLAVTALLADREGDIWFGDGQKLVGLRQPPILTYQLPSNVADKGVGAIATDPHGHIWFAGLQGGLFRMDGFVPRPVTVGGLDRDTVYSIDCAGDDIWLGRKFGGLSRLRIDGSKNAIRSWATKDGLVDDSINVVRTASDGSVWAGSLTKGLSHFQNDAFQNFDANSFGSNSITAIETASDGSVHVATPAGLYEFHAGSWQQELSKGSPLEIFSLLSAGDTLLVGTEQGVSYLDRKSHTLQSLSGSTLQDPVVGMALQGKKIWLSTTGQLFSAVLGTNRSSAFFTSVRSYNRTDGLDASQGVRRARSIVSDAMGNVYVSTYAGLSVIAPDVGQAAVPALAHVSSIEADETYLPVAGQVHIPAGTRRTTLSFDGLDFAAPEQVRLRYRLDGFDQTWSETTISRQATYTNLRPGSYTFRVLARNSQGDWSPYGATLPIEVDPTLFQRGSVRICLFVLSLFLAVWIYRARVQFVIARANAFAEERISERTRIARDLHDTLLQGFISVLMHLHIASEPPLQKSEERQNLKPILEMMEQVIEEGRLAVQGLRSPDGELTDLESCFSSLKEANDPTFHVKYRFQVRGQKRSIHPVVCEEVGRIGKEAIANAFRHSDAQEISVCLHYSRTSLELMIKDNGVGIDPRVIAKGKVGHWGLLGMRERAKHIGARLEITSNAKHGSTVIVSVPSRTAFRS